METGWFSAIGLAFQVFRVELTQEMEREGEKERERERQRERGREGGKERDQCMCVWGSRTGTEKKTHMLTLTKLWVVCLFQ